MRSVQVLIFALGVLSFLTSAFFVGQGIGDTLWRVGVGVMLTDIVCASLWPTAKTP
jgi:hypothetical protein